MKVRWRSVYTHGRAPTPRCAHSVGFSETKGLVVYGGWDGKNMLSDLWLLNLESMTWSRPITKGITPGCRAGHTATVVGNKCFIFGGGDGQQFLSDLVVLDLQAMEWFRPELKGGPSPRSRHSATLIGGSRILVIGGGGPDQEVYNDVHILDTETLEWSSPLVEGSAPTPCWGQTATLIDANQVLLFGGHTGERMLNEILILDLKTMKWVYPTISGDPPEMTGHTASLMKFKDTELVVFFGGGNGNELYSTGFILDLKTYQWQASMFVSDTIPHPRCEHAVVSLSENKIILFGGGGSENNRFKDVYMADLVDPEDVGDELLLNRSRRNTRKRGKKQNSKDHQPQVQLHQRIAESEGEEVNEQEKIALEAEAHQTRTITPPPSPLQSQSPPIQQAQHHPQHQQSPLPPEAQEYPQITVDDFQDYMNAHRSSTHSQSSSPSPYTGQWNQQPYNGSHIPPPPPLPIHTWHQPNYGFTPSHPPSPPLSLQLWLHQLQRQRLYAPQNTGPPPPPLALQLWLHQQQQQQRQRQRQQQQQAQQQLQQEQRDQQETRRQQPPSPSLSLELWLYLLSRQMQMQQQTNHGFISRQLRQPKTLSKPREHTPKDVKKEEEVNALRTTTTTTTTSKTSSTSELKGYHLSAGSSNGSTSDEESENREKDQHNDKGKSSIRKSRDQAEVPSNNKGYSRDATKGNKTELAGVSEESDPVDDISKWLASLGLSKYEQNFRREEITWEVLPMLTEDHLINVLKVDKLGERLKILSSIRSEGEAEKLRAELDKLKLKEELSRLKEDIERLAGEVVQVGSVIDKISDML